MILLMEITCGRLMAPYFEDNEQTVGFHVDVKHLAATRIGQRVTVTVRLEEVKERWFRFSVEATNDEGVKIGEGTHRRALINLKQFAGKS
jgi:fluoroacetyl-CoA thioesterase